MVCVRPFRPARFADHVGDAWERWRAVVSPTRHPSDRSKFVCYARSAARLAEWRRAGDLVTGAPQFVRLGPGWLGLVDCTDIEPTATPKQAEVDHICRLLEATNCQVVPQLILVSGEGRWSDPTCLDGHGLTPEGNQAPLAATLAFSGARSGTARSQLLAYLVGRSPGPDWDFRAEPWEQDGRDPILSEGSPVSLELRPAIWPLQEYQP